MLMSAKQNLILIQQRKAKKERVPCAKERWSLFLLFQKAEWANNRRYVRIMALTRIVLLALIKTAKIIFGSFRAGVICKILSFALIKSRTLFTRVKYLTSYIRSCSHVTVRIVPKRNEAILLVRSDVSQKIDQWYGFVSFQNNTERSRANVV